jgi:prepilin-type N-terminal cleavage/methylation domain-containing protein
MPMNRRPNQPRLGFTMTELVVVVAIILILASILIPVLAMLRRSASRAATLDLIQHVNTALTYYLEKYPFLGDNPGNVGNSDDFIAAPWKFLHIRAKKEPHGAFLELKTARLAKGTTLPYQMATMNDADHILDHFEIGDRSNLLIFTVVPDKLGAGASARWFTKEIRVRSTAGTKNDPSDDIEFVYTKDSGQFESVK